MSHKPVVMNHAEKKLWDVVKVAVSHHGEPQWGPYGFTHTETINFFDLMSAIRTFYLSLNTTGNWNRLMRDIETGKDLGCYRGCTKDLKNLKCPFHFEQAL